MCFFFNLDYITPHTEKEKKNLHREKYRFHYTELEFQYEKHL